MARTTAVAAGFLGLGFGWVTYVAVLVEPGMGFQTPGDFLDAEKVAAGYTSAVWLVSNWLYLLFPVAILLLARPSDDPWLRWSGLAAALLFLVVGSIDRVGIQLPDLLSSDETVVSAVGAMLPVRFALLKAAVLALGVFAWRTTRTPGAEGWSGRLWRGFGWLTLVAAVLFMAVFLPVPVLLFFWGTGLAVMELRTSRNRRQVAPAP